MPPIFGLDSILTACIASCGLVAGWIFTRRALYLLRGFNLVGRELTERALTLVERGEVERARELCKAAPPRAVIPQLIRRGLNHARRSKLEISRAIDAAALEALPSNLRAPSPLFALSTVAIFLGVLGTVGGLVVGYSDWYCGHYTDQADCIGVSIGVALHSTLYGLVVAVACRVGQALLTAMAERASQEIDECATKLENGMCRS